LILSTFSAEPHNYSLMDFWSNKPYVSQNYHGFILLTTKLTYVNDCVSVSWQTHTHTTVLRPFFRDHPGEPVPEEKLLDFMVQGKINRGRHTDHPAGHHSIRTNQRPPPPSPILDKLHVPGAILVRHVEIVDIGVFCRKQDVTHSMAFSFLRLINATLLQTC